MAQLALGLAGAAVGTFFGAPGVGFAIGSALGGALFAPKPKGPSPLDTKWTGVEYGASMPWYSGEMRMASWPLWLGPKIPVAQTTDTKGGGDVVSGYEYYADVLLFLSDQQSAALLDVIDEGRRIWTSRADAGASVIEASNSSEHWEDIRFYGGADDQEPDPDYEAAVGIGNAPAYLGWTTVFIKRCRLTGNAQIPAFNFITTTKATPGEPDVVLLVNAETAIEDESTYAWPATVTDVERYAGNALTGVVGNYGMRNGTDEVNSVVFTGVDVPFDDETSCCAEGFIYVPEAAPGGWSPFICRDQDSGEALVLQWQETVSPKRYYWQVTFLGQDFVTDQVVEGDGQNPIGFRFHWAVVYEASTNVVRLFIGGLPVLSETYTGGATSVVLDTFRLLTTNSIDPGRVTEDSVRFTVGRARYTSAFTPPTTSLTDDSGQTWTPEPEDLADVVTQLHERCGQSSADIDVSALVGTEVFGVIAGQVQPVRQILEQLATRHHFERIESGGLLKYVPLGGDSVVTIPYADMGVGVDGAATEPLRVERANDKELPAKVSISYLNRRTRLQTGTEYSDRLATQSQRTTQIQLGIAMNPNQAKGLASTLATKASVERTTFRFSVGMKYAYLEPTDPVTLTARSGTTYRARITEVSEANGVLDCTAVLDDAFIYRNSGLTRDDYAPPTDIALSADTEMVLLDIAATRDSEAGTPGHLVAATGSGRWPYASIRRSIDGSDFSNEVARIYERGVIGVALTVLDPAPPIARIDRYGTLQVRVRGTLSSSNRAAMQQDREINVLAVETTTGFWEVLRFRTRVLDSTDGTYNTYTLSGLHRAMLGTEWAVGLHQAGDRVVLLTPAGGSRSVEHGTAEIGLTRQFRGVTGGRPISSAASQSFAPQSVRLKPLSPARARVARDTSGNAELQLVRRPRWEYRVGGVGGSYFPVGEETEAYEVDIYADDTFATVVDTLVSESATVPYSATDQTAAGLTPGDPINFRAYQLSAVVGRGYALEKTA